MLLRNKNILCIGGLDPSGAAGVLADTRMVHALGGHASGLVTLNTSQSRSHWRASLAIDLSLLRQQWQCLRRDLPIHAVSIGAVATLAQAQWLAQALPTLEVPIVLDPVLRSSSGGQLSNQAAIAALLPVIDVITPNQAEATQLFGQQLESLPIRCTALITGSDEARAQGLNQISHHLHHDGKRSSFESTLLPGQYRGSGGLLATALACHLAAGFSLHAACTAALQAVEQQIRAAWKFQDQIHLPQIPT